MHINSTTAAVRLMICLVTSLGIPSAGFSNSFLAVEESNETLGFRIESDSADRIVLAGKLRTLTQQVAASSCAIATDVDVEFARDTLEQSAMTFYTYVNALRYGDEELNIIRPEENARLVFDLDQIEIEWTAIQDPIADILNYENSLDSARIINENNQRLLELTTVLSSNLVGQHAHPYEMTASDAMLIEITGRQLMLTQKMAKNSCAIWANDSADEEATKELADSMEIFDASLNALRFGMPEAGLRAAPTDGIGERLDILLERWQLVKASQQILIDGGELTQDQKRAMFHNMQLESTDLERLLDHYREFSERAH